MSGPTIPPGTSALKLALMAQQVRAQAVPVLKAEPIAIIGMACRAPGAQSPEELWRLVRDGACAAGPVPADRWAHDEWFDADPAAAGRTATDGGSFLSRIDGFDAEYFGILPREADRMDPQQRLFLEVAIEALDAAGQTRPALRGSRSGVFVASYHNDYAQLQYSDPDTIDARTLTGTLHSVVANRLSHFLDLRGPSLTVDTACSSSLVAIHLACQSLRLGESDLAVAGGVSLIISPALMVAMSKVGFMSPDGRCKTLDAAADGFGRGEGCGVIVLKRLADALPAGDRVLAVLRGSAINQDGHSTVLAAPNGNAQVSLVQEALENARLDAARVGYVETHGTGTALGDPIEVDALAATIGRAAAGAGPCYLGATKSNIGHLEAAAGVIGVIKAVSAIRHGVIPPVAQFRELNPHIRLAGTRLVVPTATRPWEAGDSPRCAAVSSFGVGGTNAHVILEEAPRLPEPGGMRSPRSSDLLLPLSAASDAALRQTAARWAAFLEDTDADLHDVCATAGQRRTHLDRRLGVVGRSAADFAARLRAYADGSPGAAVACGGRAATGAPPQIGFVFSGQGPQWFAMARELFAQVPAFAAVIRECDTWLRPLAGWSLVDELMAGEAESRLDQTVVAQPALFAVHVAIAAVLRSWGVHPAAVAGHSLGEIAALHLAGVLTLPDAVRVVWHRGRIMQAATGTGCMAALSLAADEAEALAAAYPGRLSVAAINAPRSVVISGDTEAVDAALAAAASRGIAHRRLPVNYAFHSEQMAPFESALSAALAGLVQHAPTLPVYSTVTGTLAAGGQFDPAYFGRNVRRPVRFADAVTAMAAAGIDVFVEIGPHPVLAAAIDECVESFQPRPRVFATLRRTHPEREALLHVAAGAFAAGAELDWAAIAGGPARIVDLPAYEWQRSRHWLGSATRLRASSRRMPVDPLGLPAPASNEDRPIAFEREADASDAWLRDHRLFDRVVMPAAAMMDALVAAARQVTGRADAGLAGLAIERPLVLAEAGAPWRWRVVTDRPGSGAGVEFQGWVDSGGEGAWRTVASATIADSPTPAPDLAGGADASVPAADVYRRFEQVGVSFGPAFRCLRDVRRGDGIAEAALELAPGSLGPAAGFLIPPTLLDAAIQLCSVAVPDRPGRPTLMLPIGADAVTIAPGGPGTLRARVRLTHAAADRLVADLTVDTESGARVATVVGLRFAAASRRDFDADNVAPLLHRIAWMERQPADAPPVDAAGTWLVFDDGGTVGGQVVGELAAAGATCLRVQPGERFHRTGGDTWTVNPTDAAHMQRLLNDVQAAAGRLAGVIHLWSVGLRPPGTASDGSADDGGAWVLASMLHLVRELAGNPAGAGPVTFVTRGAYVVTGDEAAETLSPRAAGVWGLSSVTALEHPELNAAVVDLDPGDGPLADVLPWLLRRDDEGSGTAVRGGRRFVPRLQQQRSSSSRQAQRLVAAAPGTLEGVKLQAQRRDRLQPDCVRLAMTASGVNFRDVLLALGMYPDPSVPLGAEGVGIVVEKGAEVDGLEIGDRVFGFIPGGLATEVDVPAAFVRPVPDALDDDVAAAMPVAFLTAYYGLVQLAKVQPGERVLIHAAAGGVGMAAVQVARSRGAEVLATAGSPAKRDAVRALGVRHVFDSRSLSFADAVLEATGGEGVHVVLNSLAGEFIGAGLRVLARRGRFLEIGKRDILTPEAMAAERPDVAYFPYDLGQDAHRDRGLVARLFALLDEDLERGAVSPLPVKAFELADAPAAFRFMAGARHIGKIVLRTGGTAAPPVLANATYLITGGLGALGLETARWLASVGARHIVLAGRHAASERLGPVRSELESRGVTLDVRAVDVGNRAAVKALLETLAATHPPVRGVFHAAGATHDAVLLRQDWDEARTVLGGKADGAWILHDLTAGLRLDFFVCYSAAGLWLGAPGQGLYPAANAQLDALMQARRRQGRPGLSVAWGPWAGAGMAARMTSGSDQWSTRGLRPIEPGTAFAALERLLAQSAAHALVLPIDWHRFHAHLPAGRGRSLFADVAPPAGAAAPTSGPASSALADALAALPADERPQALLADLTRRAVQVLGLDEAISVPPERPLREIGLDSLMAVEFRNTLAHTIGQRLPATLLFDYPTLAALADHLAARLGLEPRRETAPADPVAGHDDLAALDDAAAEALLLAELGLSGSERGEA